VTRVCCAGAIVTLGIGLAPGVARADAPDPRPKTRVFVDAVGGLGTEKMTGLELRRYDVALGLRMRPRDGGWELPTHLRFQPGVTENGLTSYRSEFGAGIGSAGRIRVSAGGHLVYTMVLRRSVDDAFRRALFGDIGAFGIGVHATLAAELVSPDPVGIFVSVRALAEVLAGGSAVGGTAMLGFTFDTRPGRRVPEPAAEPSPQPPPSPERPGEPPPPSPERRGEPPPAPPPPAPPPG
jgi:hypothetical protein